MSQYVDEWRAPTFRTASIFFALVAVVLWLVARHGRILTPVERFALLVTTVAGFTTIRGIVWFGLVAIVVVPKLVDKSLNRKERADELASPRDARSSLRRGRGRRPRHATGSVAARTRRQPSHRAARIVNTIAARDPSLVVFASERYSDWLLWKDPQLSGRLVYDIRFELFDQKRFAQLASFHVQGEKRDEIAAGARLLVLDARADALAAKNFAADAGAKILYKGSYVIVIETLGLASSTQLVAPALSADSSSMETPVVATLPVDRRWRAVTFLEANGLGRSRDRGRRNARARSRACRADRATRG